MVLLEKLNHCGNGFRYLIYAQATLDVSDYFSLPLSGEKELLTPFLTLCLPACCLTSSYDDIGLNL